MKKAHRPKFSINKAAAGFRIHMQDSDGQALLTMLEEFTMAAPFMKRNTSLRCVDACVTEVMIKLKKATVIIRQEFDMHISYAQACALHHAFKFDIDAANITETVFQVQLLIQLDKLVA
jgi:hypothetical protein